MGSEQLCPSLNFALTKSTVVDEVAIICLSELLSLNAQILQDKKGWTVFGIYEMPPWYTAPFPIKKIL